MKRTCNGCRALNRLDINSAKCELGKEIAMKSDYKGIGVEYKPLEECAKPKTTDEYYRFVMLGN